MTNNFELLRNKEIIAILDGDKEFGEYSGIKIRMPYLSGPDICEISSLFGLAVTYSWSGGALSRWQYMDNLIKYCIEENKTSRLLSYLFAIDRFVDLLKGLPPEEIKNTYSYIIQKIMEQINGILYFGGHELAVVGQQYIIKKIGTVVKIETPTIKIVDRDYIKGLAERAMKDIDENHYDSAITKARTILEETFCYVIEQKGAEPTESGDIGRLYGQVKNLYHMHPNKDMDKRINMLLSGLEKIISSIAEMRNKESDSHGVGSKRIGISDYHARLFVNASVMMADFILSVYKNSLSSK